MCKLGQDIVLGWYLTRVQPNLFQFDEATMSFKPTQPGYKVMIQGIFPPLETSLYWLHKLLAHLDSFLYICIVFDTK
jgi:hypothetical protein